MTLVELTSFGGAKLAVDKSHVVEINTSPWHKGGRRVWVCFIGGGASPVKESMEELERIFCPPFVKLARVSDGLPVIVNPTCVARIAEGHLKNMPCCWINYAAVHKRRALAVKDDLQRLVGIVRPVLCGNASHGAMTQ